MIKAKDTAYNGYLFRSRLEARWAVFFDQVDAKYEYEMAGFDLPSGPYLPDFYIPQAKTFVEIKPHWGPGKTVWPADGGEPFYDPGTRECQLITELAQETGAEACIAYGDPWQAMNFEHTSEMFWWPEGSKKLLQRRFYNYWSFSRLAAKTAREARFEHGAQA